jgi:hypothetical protein
MFQHMSLNEVKSRILLNIPIIFKFAAGKLWIPRSTGNFIRLKLEIVQKHTTKFFREQT